MINLIKKNPVNGFPHLIFFKLDLFSVEVQNLVLRVKFSIKSKLKFDTLNLLFTFFLKRRRMNF